VLGLGLGLDFSV